MRVRVLSVCVCSCFVVATAGAGVVCLSMRVSVRVGVFSSRILLSFHLARHLNEKSCGDNSLIWTRDSDTV